MKNFRHVHYRIYIISKVNLLHMASSPIILDSDFRYIDKKGNLLKTRTELTVAQMLTFLEQDYEYNHKVTLKNGTEVIVDFKTQKGLSHLLY